jgi:hypothetical protein
VLSVIGQDGCGCDRFRPGLEFGGQLFDFSLEGRVFGPLALEEAGGEAGLGLDAVRGEQVGVGAFVAAIAEVLDLDPALIDDGADAEIGAAQTQAQGLGEVALGGLGVGRKVLEDLVVAFFVHGGGGFRHATALPGRAGMGWGWSAVA